MNVKTARRLAKPRRTTPNFITIAMTSINRMFFILDTNQRIRKVAKCKVHQLVLGGYYPEPKWFDTLRTYYLGRGFDVEILGDGDDATMTISWEEEEVTLPDDSL